MVLRRQDEFDNVLGRVYMYFLLRKHVVMFSGHFEKVWYYIYDLYKNKLAWLNL